MTSSPLKSGVTLYFVRHGETHWNAERRYQGQIDTDLNDTGRQQAARNGEILKAHLGERIHELPYIASPLKRTSDTMRIARRAMGLAEEPFATDDRLKEIHYGHWEGFLWNEVKDADPEGYAARKTDPWAWQPRGGESYKMLSDRVAGWAAEIDRDMIVVAHGGISRVLRGLLLGVPPVEVTTLEVPQDKVMIIRTGEHVWI